MKIGVRYIVAAILLVFAWKGNEMTLSWPPAGVRVPAGDPSPEQRQWASDVRAIAARMLPSDRTYLSNMYDAMAMVVRRDAERAAPIIDTTEAFARFHGGSLDFSIDLEKVGIYPGLDKAIDKVFFEALGTDEPRALKASDRERLIDACNVLSYTFGIGRDG